MLRPDSMKKIPVIILIVGGVLTFLLIFPRLDKEPSYITQTQIIMATEVTIKAKASSEDIKKAFEAIRKIDYLMNDYNPESEISLLNREGKREVSPELAEVVDRAIHFSRITEGAFDITVLPLVRLWQRMEKEKRPPTSEELKDTLSLVGYEKIKVDNNILLLEKEGMGLDVGGIAKGYAVDKAIDVLRKRGVKNALVNAGGDLYCLGEAPQGKWKIGIQNPRKMGEIIEVIEVKDRAVATSGDYLRYYMIWGKRFGHIINPDTVWTVQDNPMSVTIVCSNVTDADALATGV
ncbi:FAD:protein FMN transferase, partial [Candidatus Aerophobetes bacterium]|nr:FAD:protein FMN transferase [Candidatus Aerophobetes bacterium]